MIEINYKKVDQMHKDRLFDIRQHAINLEKYLLSSNSGKLTYEPSKQQFIPPSPLFTYVHRYPRIAGLMNLFLYWDASLCIYLNRLSYKSYISKFFKTISRLGDGWFWYGILIILTFIGGIQKLHQIISTICISLLGVIVYKLLKLKIVRPRPYQVHQIIMPRERPLDVFSFPSGHTMQAVLFTTSIGYFWPLLLWFMIPFSILVALSRMILGLHYPTDVIVGAILGFILSFLAPELSSIMETMSISTIVLKI